MAVLPTDAAKFAVEVHVHAFKVLLPGLAVVVKRGETVDDHVSSSESQVFVANDCEAGVLVEFER